MMPPSGFEPVEGKRFTFQTRPAGAWDGVIHCEVLEVTPNERLAYAWKGGTREHRIRLTAGHGGHLALSRVENGTRLGLVHAGFVLPRNDSAHKTMTKAGRRLSEASAPPPAGRTDRARDASREEETR
jgi:uncharacterized protein YndB with AHSA1/START domain